VLGEGEGWMVEVVEGDVFRGPHETGADSLIPGGVDGSRGMFMGQSRSLLLGWTGTTVVSAAWAVIVSKASSWMTQTRGMLERIV
jgi:hypothetical protein